MSAHPTDDSRPDERNDPAPGTGLSGNKLLIVMGLLAVTFLAELVGGLFSKSLSLVSDSFHMLGDMFALGLAFGAVTIANRRLPTEKMTYGYGRLEVLSALLNGVTLVAASAVILSHSVERFFDPRVVKLSVALPIAGVGLAVNCIAVFLLRGGGIHKHDLNVKGAYLHVMADLGASVAVIVGLVAYWQTGLRIIDPIVAGLISLALFIGAIRVLRESAGILLQQSPHDVAELRDLVRSVDNVVDIDDFRLWQICSHMVIGTAHIITEVKGLEDTEEIAGAIRDVLEERYQVKHLTLQFETREMWEKHTHEVRHDERPTDPAAANERLTGTKQS